MAQNLTTSIITAYDNPTSAKSGVGISMPFQKRAQALTRRAFFVPIALWWTGQKRPRVRRFSFDGNANSVQSATLMISINRGSFQNQESSVMNSTPITAASDRQLTVEFHGTTLNLVEHNQQPFVSAKQISEAIGLDWPAQYSKLNKNRTRWGIAKIAMASTSGKQSTICIPFVDVLSNGGVETCRMD